MRNAVAFVAFAGGAPAYVLDCLRGRHRNGWHNAPAALCCAFIAHNS